MVSPSEAGERLELKARYAFSRGELAKQKGFMRVSPFYESPIEDAYFFGGYDGDTFDWVTSRIFSDTAQA